MECTIRVSRIDTVAVPECSKQYNHILSESFHKFFFDNWPPTTITLLGISLVRSAESHASESPAMTKYSYHGYRSSFA
jgi:hypothetical protein